MCFSPNILLEPVSPGNKSRKFPEHLLTGKHCTLTLHVKAASLASPFIYPRMLRCSEQGVLQCSVTQPRNAGKHRTGLPSMLQNWTAQMRQPSARGT
jgi:hypothetical protein